MFCLKKDFHCKSNLYVLKKIIFLIFILHGVNLLGQKRILYFENIEIKISSNFNNSIPNQAIKVVASSGNPDFILSADPYAADWLILPKKTTFDSMEIGIVDNLPIGKYSTTLYAIDQPDRGYVNGELKISIEILKD